MVNAVTSTEAQYQAGWQQNKSEIGFDVGAGEDTESLGRFDRKLISRFIATESGEVTTAVTPTLKNIGLFYFEEYQAPFQPDHFREVLAASRLDHFRELLAESHYITDLEENWDGHSARRVSEATFARALDLVIRAANEHYRNAHLVLPEPSVQPGIDGDIDIYWSAGRRTMIINVPATASELPSFFGKDSTDDRIYIEGTLDPDRCASWVAGWLSC
jgi:hypothetical protein